MKTTALTIALVALLLGAPLPGHADEDAGTRMDLEFEDTDVRQVITRIAELSGQNVIMSPKVTGRLTVKFAGTPWRKALDQVAQSVGAVVIEEDFGILRIVPKAEAPPTAKTALGAAWRKKLDRLRADVADVRARIAKAQAEGDARRVESLQRRLEKQQERLDAWGRQAGVDAALRALGAPGGAGGKARKPAIHTTTVTKQSGAFVRLKVDAERAGTVPLLAGVPGVEDAEIAKARARVKDFTAALEHLMRAGALDEVRRLRARLAQARAALDAALKQRAEARAAAERARARKHRSAHQEITRRSPAGRGDLQASIEALRKDVGALRGEVRELTGLVRQLLKERPGAR